MELSISPFALIRLLKGAPLSCLTVLLLSREPVQAAWLCQATGYGAHSVTDALSLLETLGILPHDSHRSGWQLLPSARQALVASYLEPGDPEEHLPLVGSQEDFALEERDPEVMGRYGGISSNRVPCQIAKHGLEDPGLEDPGLKDPGLKDPGQIAIRDPEDLALEEFILEDRDPEVIGGYGGISSNRVPCGIAECDLENSRDGVKLTTVVKLNTESGEVNLLTFKKDQLNTIVIVNKTIITIAVWGKFLHISSQGPPDRGPGCPARLGSVQAPVTAGRRRARSRSRRDRGT